MYLLSWCSLIWLFTTNFRLIFFLDLPFVFVRADTLLPLLVTLATFVGAFFENARAVRRSSGEIAAMRLDRRRSAIFVLDLVVAKCKCGRRCSVQRKRMSSMLPSNTWWCSAPICWLSYRRLTRHGADRVLRETPLAFFEYCHILVTRGYFGEIKFVYILINTKRNTTET